MVDETIDEIAEIAITQTNIKLGLGLKTLHQTEDRRDSHERIRRPNAHWRNQGNDDINDYVKLYCEMVYLYRLCMLNEKYRGD